MFVMRLMNFAHWNSNASP